MEWMNRTYCLDEISELAEMILELASSTKVITFEGDLGAGKTTLISAICKKLSVRDSVGSPTFSIINEYQYVKEGRELPIYHIDLYRLEDEEEAQQAGIEDCLFSGHLCLVEWPQKVPSIFPDNIIQVQLKTIDDRIRMIHILSDKNV